MSSRTLKTVLAVSVALNLFAVAAGVSLLVTRAEVEKRVEAQHRPARTGSSMTFLNELDPEVRDRVRGALRASALAARPDFEQARQTRRQAVELARSETFDPARVQDLLDQSRAAELRGRARLEAGAVALLADLEPDDRQAVSQILTRRGRSAARESRPPAPDAAPPSG